MLTRELFLPHDVIVDSPLHMVETLQNVVDDARFHVVETGPIIALLEDSPVRVNRLLDSKRPLRGFSLFLSHFLLSEVICERVFHTQHLTAKHV